MVGASFEANLAHIEKPHRKIPVHVKGIKDPIELEAPNLETTHLKSDLVMPLGATALFELPDYRKSKTVLLFTVRKSKPR